MESGVDHQTAFLQAFWGVYYVSPPIPRPDYIGTVKELHTELKNTHAYLTQQHQECETALAYMDKLTKQPSPK